MRSDSVINERRYPSLLIKNHGEPSCPTAYSLALEELPAWRKAYPPDNPITDTAPFLLHNSLADKLSSDSQILKNGHWHSACVDYHPIPQVIPITIICGPEDPGFNKHNKLLPKDSALTLVSCVPVDGMLQADLQIVGCFK